MSGISNPGPIKRAGDVEYARVLAHAKDQARCLFCRQWHKTDAEGAPIDPANVCVARFARHKTVVLTARRDNLGNKMRANDDQMKTAVNHAFVHGN